MKPHLFNKLIVGKVCYPLIFLLVGFFAPYGHCSPDWKEYSEQLKRDARSGNSTAQGIVASFIEMDGIGGNYTEAFNLAQKAASTGNPYGKYALGKIFKEGKGATKDKYKSRVHFEESFPKILQDAKNGNPVSQYLVAEAYNWGNGVTPNAGKAAKWSKMSIKQNFFPAYHQLAKTYLDDLNTFMYEDSLKKAAEMNFPASQLALSTYYMMSFDGDQKEKSKDWMVKALNNGCAYLKKGEQKDVQMTSVSDFDVDDKTSKNDHTAEEVFGNTATEPPPIEKKPTSPENIESFKKFITSMVWKSNDKIRQEYSDDIINQNEQIGWGIDGESFAWVHAVTSSDSRLAGVVLGISQIINPEKNIVVSYEAVSPTITTGSNRVEVSNPFIFKIERSNPEDPISIRFIDTPPIFYMGSGSLFSFKEEEYDVSLLLKAMEKVKEWSHQISGRSLKSFDKKIPNCGDFYFAYESDKEESYLCILKPDNTVYRNPRLYPLIEVENIPIVEHHLKMLPFLKSNLNKFHQMKVDRKRESQEIIDALE